MDTTTDGIMGAEGMAMTNRARGPMVTGPESDTGTNENASSKEISEAEPTGTGLKVYLSTKQNEQDAGRRAIVPQSDPDDKNTGTAPTREVPAFKPAFVPGIASLVSTDPSEKSSKTIKIIGGLLLLLVIIIAVTGGKKSPIAAVLPLPTV